MFLRNILLENYSSFEEHSNFIHSQMFRWIIEFGIGVIVLIIESSHFAKSVIVIVILVTKM
jgi:hypothetical protein